MNSADEESASKQEPARLFLFDTGPLLTFSMINKGPAMLYQFVTARASGAIATDIEWELRGLRNNQTSTVKNAAEVALRQYGWIERVDIDGVDDLEEIETLKLQLDTHKPPARRRARASTDREDHGECATILLAMKQRSLGRDVLFVCNDLAATGLAGSKQFETMDSIDVLRALVEMKTLSKKQALGAAKQMEQGQSSPGHFFDQRDFDPNRDRSEPR